MISVDSALKIILKDIKILDKETVDFEKSLGRVLAEDICASSDIPGFDNSAVDGYAVKALDTRNASRTKPKILTVIEDRKAGYVSNREIKSGQAIRIMTGAVMPKGADSVVMVEDTLRLATGCVKIFRPMMYGDNVRRSGESIKRAETVISKGACLNSAHVGLLASLGRTSVKVAKKPRVAILATGDEVVEVGRKLKPGKIWSSNSYTLSSQVLECGGVPKNLGISGDNPRQLEKKIMSGLDCDLILTSGGVSVGDYDLVKDILAKIGTNIRFWKVAMRPGKPLVFGTIKGIPVFGLPGNPVSSMISFDVFARAVILKMLGRKDSLRREFEAVLEKEIVKKKGLSYFIRANTRWQDRKFVTESTGPQGSAILKSMAQANSLIILPENEEIVKKGSRVRVRFLG